MTEAELTAQILYHNQLYWVNGTPEISDEAYDALLRELAAINPNHELLQKVYAPAVVSSGKVRHSKPMLSLDKAYSLEEVLDWAGKYIRTPDELLLIEPKYDGISARYANGVLATRGDGFEGENISDKIPLLELEAPNYRGKLDRPARGEIIIRSDDFQTLYQNIRRKDGKLYKNSRNAVAGIMGLKDITPMLEQHAKLTLVDYSLVQYTLPANELVENWQELVNKIEKLPYPMDGIVIKLADSGYSDSLGDTAHHPRGQIAFKFSGIRRESRIRNIEWSFGKNNLTPVAELDPVDIGGVTIKRATLHNLQNVLDKDLQINDLVIVERAGDVIPYIVSSTPGENRYSNIPEDCPGCGAKLIRKGPELCCINPDCFESKLRRLLAAVRNLGIEQLGEPTIRNMMTSLNVRRLSDLFRLTADDLKKLDAFADKKSENLLKEIAAARIVPDYQLLASLNIPNVGINIAKLLLANHTLPELRQLPVEELQQIPGIGPERASAIAGELAHQSTYLDELLEDITLTRETEHSTRPTICFTGKMPEKRSFYEDLARERGYEPVDTVTATLSLLVADNPSGNSSKLQKARKNNVKIISLTEFLELPPSTQSPANNPHPRSVEKEQPEKKQESEQLTFGF